MSETKFVDMSQLCPHCAAYLMEALDECVATIEMLVAGDIQEDDALAFAKEVQDNLNEIVDSVTLKN